MHINNTLMQISVKISRIDSLKIASQISILEYCVMKYDLASKASLLDFLFAHVQ